MNALRITVLCVCAGAGAWAQTNGEWTVNRLPGHTKVWTAARSSQEVERVASAAAFAYSPSNPPPASGGNVVSVNGQTGAVTVTASGIGALTNETDAAALMALGVHTNRTDNPHSVTAAQVGALTNETDAAALASIDALYTLMLTNRIEKVWDGTNAWYTFASNTITRYQIERTNCWILTVHEELYESGSGSQVIADTGVYLLPQIPAQLPSTEAEYTTVIPPYGATFTISGNGAVIIFYSGWGNTNTTPNLSAYDITALSETYTGWATLEFVGGATNTTVYYMQTNMVPPETWARSDMDSWLSTNTYVYSSWYVNTTNWMEDGNAGQLWVTSLADSSANLILNGHVNATEPHAGKYALQTGGAMTNLTIHNGTIDGDTLIGAVAVTNAVLANQSLAVTLYGYGSLTSSVPGAFRLTNAMPTTPLAVVTNLATTNNAYVAKFVTATNQRFSRILQGTVQVHMHHRKGAAGAATLKPELYILDQNGAKLWEYETAQYSEALTTTSTDSAIPIPIPSNIVLQANQRLSVYIKANVTSGAPDIYIDTEDNVNFILSVPIPSAEFVTQSQLQTAVSAVSAPTVYTPITSVPIVGAGQTNVVTITSEKRIYLVTATNAVNYMTNVFSGVTVGGSNVAWELWVNFTNPAGTNMTWCPCMRWDVVPSITVTGLYKFACSTIDGVTMQAQQIYPSAKIEWQPAYGAIPGSYQAYGAATNSTIHFDMPMIRGGLLIYRIRGRGTSVTPITNNIGYASFVSATASVLTNYYVGAVINNGGKWFDYAIPSTHIESPGNNNATIGPVLALSKYGEGQTATTTFTVFYRVANELEIKAYDAGWRP